MLHTRPLRTPIRPQFVRTGLAASSIVIVGLSLGSCAQQNQHIASSQTAADDVCRAQRLALDDNQAYFAGDIVKGALIGAAGGALTGFLFGGNATSAAIGAASGALVGGAVGYWQSQQQQGGSRTDLISRMVGDMDREQQQLDRTQANFNALVECRRASARQVNADLKAGTITREVAEQRMAGVRQLASADVAIAKRINQRLDERTANYVYATEQATGSPLPPPAPVAAAPAPSAPVASAPAPRPAPATTQQASLSSGDSGTARQSASTLVQKKQSFAASTTAAEQSIDSEMRIS